MRAKDIQHKKQGFMQISANTVSRRSRRVFGGLKSRYAANSGSINSWRARFPMLKVLALLLIIFGTGTTLARYVSYGNIVGIAPLAKGYFSVAPVSASAYSIDSDSTTTAQYKIMNESATGDVNDSRLNFYIDLVDSNGTRVNSPIIVDSVSTTISGSTTTLNYINGKGYGPVSLVYDGVTTESQIYDITFSTDSSAPSNTFNYQIRAYAEEYADTTHYATKTVPISFDYVLYRQVSYDNITDTADLPTKLRADSYVESGTTHYSTITFNNGSIPTSIEITTANTTLVENTDYTYNSTTGLITFLTDISGDVTVTGINAITTITYDGFDDTTGLPTLVGDIINDTITLNNQPYNIEITTSLGATLVQDTDYTYNSTTGIITFITTPTASITITAIYSITYNLNGGTNHTSNPATFTASDLPITLGNPTKTGGYAFEGWYGTSNFSGIQVNTISNRYENITLYAKWGVDYKSNIIIDPYGNIRFYNNTGMSTIYNYVSFNGELWRILGLFKNIDDGSNTTDRVKIVRSEPLRGAYHSANTSGLLFPDSTLQSNLNGTYYSSLSTSDQALISTLGTHYYNYVPAKNSSAPLIKDLYNYEKNTNYSFLGRFAIASASELGYTSTSYCISDRRIYQYNTNNCGKNSWMTGGTARNTWLSNSDDTATYQIYLDNGYTTYADRSRTSSIYYFPTVYLDADVLIASGNGTSDDPFVLSKDDGESINAFMNRISAEAATVATSVTAEVSE